MVQPAGSLHGRSRRRSSGGGGSGGNNSSCSADECDEVKLWQQQQYDDNAEGRTQGRECDGEGIGDVRLDLTRGQLLRIACGMLGLMFGWAMKTVLTTPLFRDVYGVDAADLGFVWLAGPLSGLVVQPAIGVISDHREGQGQRSFFFAGGAAVMAASLALLPAAGAVWRRLGASTSGRDGAGTGLAVAALWSLDLAMNASLVAIRAVVADCAPPRQQPEANTVILVSYGTGTLLGYGFSALDAAAWFGLPPGAFWKSCVDFWVAALVLLLAAAVASREEGGSGRSAPDNVVNGGYLTLSGGMGDRWRGSRQQEAVVRRGEGVREVVSEGNGACSERNGRDSAVAATAAAAALGGNSPSSLKVRLLDMALFYDVPAWLLPVCALLFFSWIGWFSIIIFGSDWVGVNVFGGDASAPTGDERREAYADGVAWASMGLAVQAVVVTAMGCGPVTRLVRAVGLKGAFITAIASQSACLLGAAFLRPGAAGRTLSLAILAVLGVSLALIESLPYMIVGMFSPRDKHGQLLGKLNVWIVLAQLALTLCVHPIVNNSKDGDASVLLAGATGASIGLVFIPAIGRAMKGAASLSSKAYEAGDDLPSSPSLVLLGQDQDVGASRFRRISEAYGSPLEGGFARSDCFGNEDAPTPNPLLAIRVGVRGGAHRKDRRLAAVSLVSLYLEQVRGRRSEL
eukprot:jgi/Undpi1/9599/HiC_scaffold_27.g12055.m1